MTSTDPLRSRARRRGRPVLTGLARPTRPALLQTPDIGPPPDALARAVRRSRRRLLARLARGAVVLAAPLHELAGALAADSIGTLAATLAGRLLARAFAGLARPQP